MKTLQDVKDNCRIDYGDDGKEHWFWQGASSAGYAAMRGPDFTKDASGKTHTAQRGRRAVWHILTGKPITKGVIIYNTCQEAGCVNPDHLKAGSRARYGRMIAMSGAWRTGVARRMASQKGAKALRKITPEMAHIIIHGVDSSKALALRYGVHTTTINRYRSGARVGLGGLFSGLMRWASCSG